MFYEELEKVYDHYKEAPVSEVVFDSMNADLVKVAIENFPSKASTDKEYKERPIVIKQQDNSWRLFIDKHGFNGIVDKEGYRKAIKEHCFKDADSAQRMFDFLGW